MSMGRPTLTVEDTKNAQRKREIREMREIVIEFAAFFKTQSRKSRCKVPEAGQNVSERNICEATRQPQTSYSRLQLPFW